MKTFYSLLIILVAFSITAYSQEETSYGFDKGDFFIAGAASYGGFISDQTTANNSLSLSPSAGYFVSSNISLGVQSEFLVVKPDNDFSFNSTAVGINGRYYFMPKKRFNVFTELSLDYTNQSRESSFFSSAKEKINGFSSTISMGMNYFITKNLSLFTKFDLLQYNYSEFESNDIFNRNVFSQKQNSIITGTGNLHLGILYKF